MSTSPSPAFSFARFQSVCNALSLNGGQIGAISRGLDYLVIGEIGSRDWIHSTHGRKIEKAIDYSGRGCHIAIVAEQHWHGYLIG
jgi:hypothetical protein